MRRVLPHPRSVLINATGSAYILLDAVVGVDLFIGYLLEATTSWDIRGLLGMENVQSQTCLQMEQVGVTSAAITE